MKKNDSLKNLLKALSEGFSVAKINSARLLSKVSAKITVSRMEREMTQTEFADFMDVTQGMVSKWESGSYNFTIRQICEICEKLELTPDIDFVSENSETVYSPVEPELTLLANADKLNAFAKERNIAKVCGEAA